ncbi:hypothetical protein TEA_020644 [Camellia sinensis var. sinensis]|uniref:Small nuclear ribonucleoprotein E n=1 Tax=Camellia sinensis var. sinensis TaxID=542762 RepID=A0A4S4DC80_CAMSN|nr:hypothetical protein TEA_020644 [Camellia sinensis var. sinensis]
MKAEPKTLLVSGCVWAGFAKETISTDADSIAAMATTKVQRIMTQPIKARIQIWLFEQKDSRIEGRIIGFDEYMNLVLDDAEEVNVKKKTRKALGENDDWLLMVHGVGIVIKMLLRFQ